MDEEARQTLARMRRPGIFADAATMGLQRPIAGAVEALKFWEPTSMGERYKRGTDQYTQDLEAQIAEAHPLSALGQGMAGSLMMGGPTGSLVKQALFDAGTAGVQGLAAGDDWGDIAGSMATNAAAGGVMNTGAKGYGKVRELERARQEMLANTGQRYGR